MQENKTIKATYEAPKVEVYEVLVEQGFSASGIIVSGSMIESPGINEDLDW